MFLLLLAISPGTNACCSGGRPPFFKKRMSGDATFTSILNGPSQRGSSGMMSLRQVATECRNSIFSATLHGKWPSKPIALPGAFGSMSRQLRRDMAKERGNPSLMHRRRRLRFKLILPLQPVDEYYANFSHKHFFTWVGANAQERGNPSMMQ